MPCFSEQPHTTPVQLYDCHGVLLRTTALPGFGCVGATWAPNGCLVALHSDKGKLWVWDLTVAAPTLLPGVSIIMPTWHTPSSSCAASVTAQGSVGFSTPLLQCSPGPQHVAGLAFCMIWGTRLALLAASREERSCRLLLLYSVQGGQLRLQQTVTAAEQRAFTGDLRLSSDGELAAILTGAQDELGHIRSDHHLAILPLDLWHPT